MNDRECIDRLTKEVRRQRLLLRFVVAAIAVTVLVGQGKAPETIDYLKVRSLSVVDDKGIPRIRLDVSPRGNADINFPDKTGTKFRLLIGVSADDACYLMMIDKQQRRRIGLSLGKAGNADLMIGDSVGSRISAAWNAKGTVALYVTDKDGHTVWRAGR